MNFTDMLINHAKTQITKAANLLWYRPIPAKNLASQNPILNIKPWHHHDLDHGWSLCSLPIK